ncbi:MAG: Gfo/Idh/MocA family oxidoreductase [Microcoleus sp. PH2017_10_PVI_O_A]|uniref:Gfo/Idh/MocA family protein n=1 Tax=unclassified Microcoleus TaxID=2642155 RepID=UPI001D308419|nr:MULTISPECIES: Gfo/Idh/MocA family oxidoreductase [unclassified Microcoleus]TAE85887.1 MAG: gfo/Idh/MocA family oxidoreductase [Oscillatoriales cyanobacterium]MCC3404120.1 Gfo/Idh/MocA family oxidoreductase [Microcoleus sp. PH2017_10_PVI_O_A]MCC3458204.1 Gfo/Idh/MocA family oxidoreductase [Microcoleus sp. PH2017_11_PCY_U_A]MCC3476626.1 Gfo/Idh/MocA family oxidoreductase [Microcoleus sp. PH2017_12_PCY_D_A]MCC3527903.1 Gfo/Idh/MocA family oxidoreductase [Microcoleus sp. PH2017_21_RUC_O_A]
MKIRIAVLGAGRWGVNLIRNFLEHPNSEVLAVVDPNFDSLVAVQKQFNLHPSVIIATDWSQIEGFPGLDAVAIATPASTHYTLATAALQQGYHVLVEKPLALNLSEAIELCELAQKQQRQLFVDHTYLFHPAVDRGQTIIQQHQLGNLRYGYAQRTHSEPVRHDVDALWDLAVHDIAIFNTWLEQTPIQVRATGTVFPKSEVRSQKSEVRSQGEEAINQAEGLADLVWVTLTYPDGFQAFIHLCWLNPDKQRRLTVVGSLGTLIFDEMSPETPLILQRSSSNRGGDEDNFGESALAKPAPTGAAPTKRIGPPPTSLRYREVLNLEPAEPLRRVCDRFLNCVQTNTPCPSSSGAASVELIRILSALSKSLELGGQPLIPF